MPAPRLENHAQVVSIDREEDVRDYLYGPRTGTVRVVPVAGPDGPLGAGPPAVERGTDESPGQVRAMR